MNLSSEDRFLAVFAYFCLLSLPFILIAIERKLDRIIRLLEIGNDPKRD